MYRKFKIKDITRISNAKRARIRKRSVRIALGLKVFHACLKAKTQEELDQAADQIMKERSMLEAAMKDQYWDKLPRKRKKKEKNLACDFFNAYALIPELYTFVISNRNEN